MGRKKTEEETTESRAIDRKGKRVERDSYPLHHHRKKSQDERNGSKVGPEKKRREADIKMMENPSVSLSSSAPHLLLLFSLFMLSSFSFSCSSCYWSGKHSLTWILKTVLTIGR